MIVRGIKSNILLTIAILLIIGMVLINFVVVRTLQQQIFRGEVARGHLLLTLIEQHLAGTLTAERQDVVAYPLDRLLHHPDFTCAVVLDRRAKLIYSGGGFCERKGELTAAAAAAIQSGQPTTRFFDKIWGVFWLQYRYMTIAVPFYRQGKIVGGAGVTTSLEHIYTRLRRSQKIFYIYILVNTLILTFVGVYRISKMYLQPLHRLAKRAEDYSENDGLIFSVRKEDNELAQLSKSLNLMLERISEDKKTLRTTVASLEKANLDLTKAQTEIIQAEKLASVGRLSAGIAHEIGNPIGIVMGYLELLKQKDITDEERSEYIRRTEAEFLRIDTIIRQLLDLSRPSSVGAEAVHVHDILSEITNVIRYQPMMSGVAITTTLEAPCDVVHADPNQLRQVFLNLMINAVDAIALNPLSVTGELTIRTKNEHSSNTGGEPTLLEISVVDNGPGIADENIRTIFDPFFTTKAPGKGIGLGLSVSFMIIESIGGKISAYSEEDTGTRMVVSLPLGGDPASIGSEDVSSEKEQF